MLQVIGFIILFALILWLIFASNQPSDSRWISMKEQKYIQSTLSLQFKSKNLKTLESNKAQITNDNEKNSKTVNN